METSQCYGNVRGDAQKSDRQAHRQDNDEVCVPDFQRCHDSYTGRREKVFLSH